MTEKRGREIGTRLRAWQDHTYTLYIHEPLQQLEFKWHMKDEYDFSTMKGRKNPFTKYLKQPVTMRLDRDVVAYFKKLADKTGVPYQSLINLYLRDCAATGRELEMRWLP